jgi:hypothetical protein
MFPIVCMLGSVLVTQPRDNTVCYGTACPISASVVTWDRVGATS